MIEVISLPPLATIQDLGRDGFWKQGLGRAGAMDPLSHSVANLLLGNHKNAATLEIPLSPAKFQFKSRTAFALVGAVCSARLDGRALPRVYAGIGQEGQYLELGAMRSGAQVYLALSGGINVPKILGSRSTQLRESFGGLEGRVLQKGDTLTAATTTTKDTSIETAPLLPHAGLSLTLPPLREAAEKHIIVRALPSAEHDSFSDKALKEFWSNPYTITPQSNRQGYRFEGPTLDRSSNGELRSHGIVPGIVQVPSGGQPIIQLADSATMGGYPKIAAVIEQDLWRIGQARPGDTVRFEKTTLDVAASTAIEEAELFARYQNDIDLMTKQLASWS